jgi:hypothetical protein
MLEINQMMGVIVTCNERRVYERPDIHCPWALFPVMVTFNLIFTVLSATKLSPHVTLTDTADWSSVPTNEFLVFVFHPAIR